MQPAEKKPEVVYRKGDVRMPPPEAAVVADLAKRAFLRAITPLVIGFLLLLGLISVLGWRSANQMEQVGTNASIRITRYFQLQNRLVELRLKVAQLDNEIRIRNTATSQKGLKPPFPFKIDTAREDLMAAIAVLDEHQVFQDPQWTQLRTRLDEYVKLSEDLEL